MTRRPPKPRPARRAVVAVAWLGCVAATLPAAAAEPPDSGEACELSDARRAELYAGCVGKKVGTIRMERCPRTICPDGLHVERLISLTDFADQVLTESTLKLGLARLDKTGLFRDVAPHCTEQWPGYRMVLETCPNRFLRKVEIEGNRYLHASEIRKRVFLRSGSILEADPERLTESKQIQRQSESIVRLYAREGLELVKPPEFVAERVNETVFDLTIRMSEADRARISAIRVAHEQVQQAASGDPRCPVVEETTLRDLLDLSVGDVITTRGAKRIRSRLEKWFRSIGFVRPRAQVTPTDEAPLRLEVVVRTKHCWQLRVWRREAAVGSEAGGEPSWRFQDPIGRPHAPMRQEPFTLSDFESWRTILPFGESGTFDSGEAARGVDALHRVLEDQGMLFADVVMEHRPLVPEGSGEKPVLGRIDYFVTKNYQRRIQDVLIPNARQLESGEVVEVISSRVYDFFDAGGFLQVDKVLVDLKRLGEYYGARGFYEFKHRLQGEPDDVAPQRRFFRKEGWLNWEYRFRDRGFVVRKRESEMNLYLMLPYAEGRRMMLDDIQVRIVGGAAKEEGRDSLTEEQALKLTGLRAGGFYGTHYLKSARRALRKWYLARGYHHVKVTATCEARDPVPLEFCDPAQVRSGHVDLVLTVEEGPRTFVGEIFWRGNYGSDPDILTRDLPESGEPFNHGDVVEATRKLRNLGIFHSVKVDEIGLDEDPPRSRVALVVAVEEAPATFLEIAAGFRKIDRANLGTVPPLMGAILGQSVSAADRMSTGSVRTQSLTIPDVLVVLELEYIHRNFRGEAEELRLPLEYGFSTQTPLRLLRFTPTWVVPRLFDSDLRLETTLRLIVADRVTEVKDYTELSIGLTGIIPLMKKMVLSAEVAGGFIRFEEPNTEQHQMPWDTDGYEPFVRFSLSWRWDNQDNPLHPTKGFGLAASVAAIIATELEEGQTRERDFVKWEASLRGALELGDGGPILAAFFRYGGSNANELHPLPPDERYTLGGSNGLRGFADNAVGRYDQNGELMRLNEGGRLGFVGGSVLISGSVELRIPIVPGWFWVAGFTDVGALAAEHHEIYPQSFRAAAGGGLRLLLGGQIPLRLDLGFILGPPRCQRYLTTNPELAPANRLECLRRDDGYAAHFEFLYPF